MANMFFLGQLYQIYLPEAGNVSEGPKDFQPSLVSRHFIQHYPCCIQGESASRFTRAFVILIYILWVRRVA